MASRARMLMISPAAPWPATTGGLVRIAGLLDQMARQFDLTLVSPRRTDQVVPHGLPARCVFAEMPDAGRVQRVVSMLDPSRPFHAAVYSRPEIGVLVRRALASERYDVVYSHFIYGMEYLADSPVPVIIDQQNVDRVYWQNKADHSTFPVNVFAAWNTRRTIAYETRFLPRIWAYVSVSDEDREQTRSYAGQAVEHFWVAPNGVDTARFAPGRGAVLSSPAITLGYLGSMDLQMNVEAVLRFGTELLPGIRARLSGVEVTFLVIGRNPSASVRSLAHKTPGMRLSGTVDDVVPWLHQVDVVVCPLRIGAGTKLKVAEAMSCGLPVVGSSLAFAGLPGRSGEHYVRVDDDASFVDAVCQLAQTPTMRRMIGRNARLLAETHLEWDAIGRHLADDINGALAR
ncbi:MAG: glycosyltransferase family 4 protein [Vicinamibacterales bacterium]